MSDTSEITQDQTRENRARRAARRQGLLLKKSRRRDKRALDWQTYMLVDEETGGIVAYGLPRGYGMTIDEVEEALG